MLSLQGCADPSESTEDALLTVVFATRNRAHFLDRVLSGFGQLTPPDGGWKLVVVDNGSSDHTRNVLRAHAPRLPLSVIHETRPGMNAALNAALPAIEGDLLVKADDDVLPCPDWLVHYRNAADRNRDSTLFGGTVEPEWPGPLPPWLNAWSANFGILYAQSRQSAGPCAFASIYGPNWAVRSQVFADGTRFDERIGPDSTRQFYPMGGETEFFRRLEAQGHRGCFVPGASVHHIVRPEQMEEGWILDRAYRNGLGIGLMRRGGDESGASSR